MHRVALIAAVARNGIIGAGNRLPWHLPEDLSRFRTLTSGHTVIMGRKTWESIGKPLPNRQNIVVSRQLGLRLDGASVAHSLDEALAMAVRPDPVFVIGGEALYRSALPLAVLLYLTEIERDFHGDARFPPFERAEWREIARETREPASGEGFAYHFATYERALD
jgi:dihydrofolate reductase